MAYTLTFIFLSLLKHENINVGLVLLKQVFIGALFGFAIAFVILAINSKIVFSIDIYHIVFGICLLSSLIQGSLMPKVSRILNMIDRNNQVIRNFNYYQGKGNITFIKSLVDADSPYIGKKLKDIYILEGFIVAKIIRDNKVLVPKGDLVVQENDALVLSGEEYFDPYGQELHEFSISDNHSWIGKMLSELNLPESELIISIDRDGSQIPPIGKTVIEKGDRILLFTIK